MSSEIVNLQDVRVDFDGRHVLGPISFSVGRDEHWALLGPNGAGKTTLLSVVGAQRHPSAGRALVLGELLGKVDIRELRKKIGVVGHAIADRLPVGATALELVLTGKNAVLAPWWDHTEADDEAAALALLETVHCAHLAQQRFGLCSQGERQRILLARALFGEHRLLLLDEPTLGVDLPGREAFVSVLDSLAASPASPATIEVVHTLEELPRSTSHALLLRAGRAVASGPAEEVLQDEPLSECFGLEFHVERMAGRYVAHASSSW